MTHNLQTDSSLSRIAPLLVCPHCRSAVSVAADAVRCAACGASFPIHDGIPLFVKPEAPEGAQEGTYKLNYQDLARAERYNVKYQTQFWKRMTTVREHKLLRSLLASQGRAQAILDIPCGGGRLSAQIAPATDLLIEADIGLGQVLYARQTSRLDVPQIWMTASAFQIPLCDGGVDGVVCIRLSHHLRTVEERERLVRELLRVAKRFVIMTFFDYHSVKNLLRRARRVLDGKSPKLTMTVSRVAGLAREGGAELAACPHLAWLGSGHRYALMVKKSS